MKEDRRDSNPANPKDDPLQRIAALERRVVVLTRENERLETFLAVLRHRIFGRSSEKMSPDQLSLLETPAHAPADPGAAEPLTIPRARTRPDAAAAVAGVGVLCPTLCRG